MIDTITNFRSPKAIRLTIACLYLNSYTKSDDQGVIAKARDVLERHNIQLDVFPANGTKSSWNTIPYSGYIEDTPTAYKELYRAAKEKIKQMGCSFVIPIPVVFGNKVCGGYGIAPNVPGELTRLIMISPTVNDDKMTLLHELGHGAGLHHDLTRSSPRNFMHEADGDLHRTVMYKYQVEAMARSPFSVG